MGRVIYFSHGGGPLPILGDPTHKAMITFMEGLYTDEKKPEAVIVVSAHWEEPIPMILGSENPSLYYDYSGFPPEAYELEYPAPGSPSLAKEIKELFSTSGIESGIDQRRGFDHGLFIPMKMIYPDADIPMTQISLKRGLDPKTHIEMGKALSSLLSENILVVGSGFSFHNMRAFDWTGSNTADPQNDIFQDWLIDILTGNYSQAQREEFLTEWDKAPGARYCHPREEHLLPLHFCLGFAGAAGNIVFDDYILGKRSLAVSW